MNVVSVLARLAGAVLIFFALDGLIFRTGYYVSVLEPDSTAGFLEVDLALEQHRRSDGPNEVIAVGDSRIPLKPRVANAAATDYRFFTIAVPGTTPRCWYYMLREVDPRARRYAGIVIPVDTYDDRLWEDLSTRESDFHYLAPVLRLTDLFEFALSYPTWDTRAQAAETVLFKGLVYRKDFQDFLVNHRHRVEVARKENRRPSGWRYDAFWDYASTAGVAVDWANRVVHLPDDFPAQKRKAVEEVLLEDPPPHSPEFAAYRRKWFGRIIERYRGTRTRLIFIRLARGPVVRPGLVTDPTSSLRDFAARGDIILVDEHHFDSLERPELFGDALHMNEAGATEFSGMLAHEVERILRGERR